MAMLNNQRVIWRHKQVINHQQDFVDSIYRRRDVLTELLSND